MYGGGKLDDLRGAARSELHRRLAVVIGALALFLLGMLGVVFAAVAIVLAFGRTHPALAAAGVAAGFFLLAGLAAWLMMRAHRRRPKAVGTMASLAGLLLRVAQAVR